MNLLLDLTSRKGIRFSEEVLKESPAYPDLHHLDPAQKMDALVYALHIISIIEHALDGKYLPTTEQSWVQLLINHLLNQKLPVHEVEFTKLCRAMVGVSVWGSERPHPRFIKIAQNYRKSAGGFTNEQADLLKAMAGQWNLATNHFCGHPIKWAHQLAGILGSSADAPPVRIERNGDIFAEHLLEDMDAMDLSERDAWAWLVAHAMQNDGSKPNGKWEKPGREYIAAVGEARFAERLVTWLPLVDKPAAESERRQEIHGSFYPMDRMALSDDHMDALKGLVWLAGMIDHNDLTRTLGSVGVSSYKKIPGVGPRATRVGNACVWALGNIGSDIALAQLAMMKVRVKFGTAQIAIGKALKSLADAKGVSTEELEEMSVPSYGLTDVGRLEETMGDFTAVLEVVDQKPVLGFRKADGTMQKSVPASVTEIHKEDLKEIKGSAKDLENMLAAQKERLDALFLQRKSWPLELWLDRYLNHPVVGIFARRLIWSFQTGQDSASVHAIWYEDRLRGLDGEPIHLTEETKVKLWHPLDSDTWEIIRWRSWLFEHLVKQPFKQAHREIYILTDAERATGVYSNRFASHILRQHQFNSLCAVRGWKNRLRLMVDDSYPPAAKYLPAWGLRAEYWIEGAGDDYNDANVNESGAYRYLVTDQVRFYTIAAAQSHAHAYGSGYSATHRGGHDEPLRMEDIPPLVLSEVLRDVDLFVGVTSVGNDPSWNDGGPEGRHENYWNSFSFGELGESAEIRKQLLETLIPRLKISKQCRLEGRFLVVEGKIRTYKIHLGSGNILMEPNDQYLCIVKAASFGGSDKVFLPFEGDGKMAIILSKAFLLAADDKITDTTILSQINRPGC